MVNTITEEKGRSTEEGDCEGDSLEVMTLVACSFYKVSLCFFGFCLFVCFKILFIEHLGGSVN